MWSSYKRSCGITDEQELRDQLRACCHEDLKKDLYSLLGTGWNTLTEQQLLEKIENIAVLAQNNLVNVVHLLAMAQDREENVREFLTRLKVQASMCELSMSLGC